MYGDTAQSWESILAFFRDLARRNSAFEDLAAFSEQLAASRFPRAGLRALASMHDLLLGPTSQILDNPHLVVGFDFEKRIFRLEYRDGSPRPWRRTADPAEIGEVVERFLVRRARWFRA